MENRFSSYKPHTTTPSLAQKKKFSDINNVKLVGRLTKDPELRQPKPGMKVCTFRLAVDLDVNDEASAETNTSKEVCFIDITVWGDEGERVSKKYHKGSKIIVDGRLKFEEWNDKVTGNKRSKHSVVADIIEDID